MANDAPDAFAVQGRVPGLLFVLVELMICQDLENKSSTENEDGEVMRPFKRSRKRLTGTAGGQISSCGRRWQDTYLAYGLWRDSVKGREMTACTTASGRKYLKRALFQKPGSFLSARYLPSSEVDLELREATW